MATHRVQIIDYTFVSDGTHMSEVVIKAGDSVEWVNRDSVGHSATRRDNPMTFDTGILAKDEARQVLFPVSGRFDYFCKVHPFMTGTVTVNAVVDPPLDQRPRTVEKK